MKLLLNSLYKLGKLWYEEESLDSISILLDDKKLTNFSHVITVDLNTISKNFFEFKEVTYREFDFSDKMNYLYKFGSSRGTDITPSCKIRGDKHINESLNNRFYKWFENNAHDEFLNAILDCLKSNKYLIYENCMAKYSNLISNNHNEVLLSLRVFEGNECKYIGDYDIFKNFILEESYKKYYTLSQNEIKGQGVCLLCCQEKELFGSVPNSMSLSFSTPEKIGNTPNFNLKDNWKQSSICGECALYLEAGKKFTEKYLEFKEVGFSHRYYVIPNFLFKSEKSFKMLYNYFKRFENDKNYKNIAFWEDHFQKLMFKFDDVLEFKFLFFDLIKGAFVIRSYVESVLPSRLGEIYKLQNEIISLNIFSESIMKEILSKDKQGNLVQFFNSDKTNKVKSSDSNWYLLFLKNFLKQPDFKFYLEIISSVLGDKKLNYNLLLSKFMSMIRKNWIKGKNYDVSILTLESLALLLFFANLKLIGGKFMELNNDNIDKNIMNSILNAPDKNATFLLGVLTRKLAYEQYEQLKSSPFINKLWGLSLDQKKIQKLYPMVLNKLQAYKKWFKYKDLEEEISINLINSENNWNLSRDETSYYFVLGFTLAYEFDNLNNEDNKNDGDGTDE